VGDTPPGVDHVSDKLNMAGERFSRAQSWNLYSTSVDPLSDGYRRPTSEFILCLGAVVSFRFGPLKVSEGALSTNPSFWRGQPSSVPLPPNGVASRLAGRSAPVGSLGSYGRPKNCTR
jgi:hypothetical protein